MWVKAGWFVGVNLGHGGLVCVCGWIWVKADWAVGECGANLAGLWIWVMADWSVCEWLLVLQIGESMLAI